MERVQGRVWETDMSVNMGVVGSGEHELSFDLVM